MINLIRQRKARAAQPHRPPTYNKDGQRRKPYSTVNRKPRHDGRSGSGKLHKGLVKVLTAVSTVMSCCLGMDETFTVSDLTNAQAEYGALSHKDKHQFIRERITLNIVAGGDDMFTTVNGRYDLCRTCWWTFHGFSKSLFYRTQRQVMKERDAGLVPPIVADGRGRVEDERAPEHFIAVEFMEEFIQLYGDPMPDDTTVQLPVSTVTELFHCYCEVVGSADRISKSAFYRLVQHDYTHIRIHEYKKFKQCVYCKKCDDKVSDRSLHPDVRRKYAERKRVHRERVRAEKQKYYHHRYKSRTQPDKYCSIIIDNMDQAKVAAPGLRRETANTEKLFKLKTHCTGVMVHGTATGPKTFCYLWPDRYPKDPNVTCSILLDVLNKIETEAEVLYLQVDGATGENKNRHLMEFCAYLVAIGVFKKIKVSFLPVGHTHEDIDQLFSRIAARIRNIGFHTVEDLAVLITASTTPAPIVFTQLPKNFDLKAHFGKVGFNNWDQITKFRAYKIQLHPDGYPVVFNRRNMAGTKQVMFTMGRHRYGTVRSSGALDAVVAKSVEWHPRYGQPVLREIPDRDQPIHLVPPRTLPYALIEQTVQKLHEMELFTDVTVGQWTSYLDRYKQEDAQCCATCTEFRVQLSTLTTSKHDSDDEANEKRNSARRVRAQLRAHLLSQDPGENTHADEIIPWPATLDARRRQARGAPLLVNEMVDDQEQQQVAGEESDSECSDNLGGVSRRQKAFVIGGVVSRRMLQPTPQEFESRKGTFVAVWSEEKAYIGEVMEEETDHDDDDELGESETNYKVVVGWYDNASKKPHDLNGCQHPGWGKAGAVLYRSKSPGGQHSNRYTSTEYFQSVLAWGVRMANKRVKPACLKRIQAAVADTLEHQRQVEQELENGSGDSDTGE